MDITKMNEKELKEYAAKLESENEELRKAKQRKLSCKVSQRGAVSVYGLNRQFPVTLYDEQWRKLQDFMPEIIAFIDKQPKGTLSKDKAESEAKYKAANSAN